MVKMYKKLKLLLTSLTALPRFLHGRLGPDPVVQGVQSFRSHTKNRQVHPESSKIRKKNLKIFLLESFVIWYLELMCIHRNLDITSNAYHCNNSSWLGILSTTHVQPQTATRYLTINTKKKIK